MKEEVVGLQKLSMIRFILCGSAISHYCVNFTTVSLS
jgi:hypothetical protein